jgi:hypothetical protein
MFKFLKPKPSGCKYYKLLHTAGASSKIELCENHRSLLELFCPFLKKPFAEWQDHENLNVIRRDTNGCVDLAVINLPAFDKELLIGPKGKHFVLRYW